MRRAALALCALAAGCECRNDPPPAAPGCVPAPELCNDVDDDCDGLVDEGFDPCASCCDAIEDEDLCADDDRVCTAEGAAACVDEGYARRELCNGYDDDCDGVGDEEVFELCVGCCDSPDDPDACLDDDRACRSDGVAVCADVGAALTELCNGLDDDCDGLADETFALCEACCDVPGGDACLDDARACEDDVLRCVDVGGEVVSDCCDGVDTDCDGAVDEDCSVYGCP